MTSKGPELSEVEKELRRGGGKLLKWGLSLGALLVVGVIGTIASGLGGRIVDHFFPAAPNISVFDVALLSGYRLYDSGLDVRLENTGAQVAYVTGFEIQLERTWQLRPSLGQVVSGGHQASTFTYTYELPPPSSTASAADVPVSQVLGPSETDRFSMLLKNDALNDARPRNTIYVFLLGVRAEYNGKTTPRKQLLLAVIGPRSDVTSHLLGPGSSAAVVKRNREALRQILQVPSTLKGPTLKNVVAELSGR